MLPFHQWPVVYVFFFHGVIGKQYVREASCLSTAAATPCPKLVRWRRISSVSRPPILWTLGQELVNVCKFSLCLQLPGILYSAHTVFSNLLKILAEFFLPAYMTLSIWPRILPAYMTLRFRFHFSLISSHLSFFRF